MRIAVAAFSFSRVANCFVEICKNGVLLVKKLGPSFSGIYVFFTFVCLNFLLLHTIYYLFDSIYMYHSVSLI